MNWIEKLRVWKVTYRNGNEREITPFELESVNFQKVATIEHKHLNIVLIHKRNLKRLG